MAELGKIKTYNRLLLDSRRRQNGGNNSAE